MIKRVFFTSVLSLICFMGLAADPTATEYATRECAGTSMPYPMPERDLRAYPDSLTPVFISHIGRHGSRYLSSSKFTERLQQKLSRVITPSPKAKALSALCRRIEETTAGRWGALDSLGIAEQRGIAARTWQRFDFLFRERKIRAISSYVPRCIASMDEFTHQLSRMDNRIEIYTSSGRQNNSLLRPWSVDEDYKAYSESSEWRAIYDDYAEKLISPAIASAYLGSEADALSDKEKREFALDLYRIVSGCAASGININPIDYLSSADYNALWAVENLDHYLNYSASTLSKAPMDMAAGLLNDIVESIDKAVAGTQQYGCELRFGHAETMIPLLALMRIGGCYYITNYFDTVGLHWRDFYAVPMASNLQMILFKSSTGAYYLRADLNETPVPLIPGNDSLYTPWLKAQDYLQRCLPLYLQL